MLEFVFPAFKLFNTKKGFDGFYNDFVKIEKDAYTAIRKTDHGDYLVVGNSFSIVQIPIELLDGNVNELLSVRILMDMDYGDHATYKAELKEKLSFCGNTIEIESLKTVIMDVFDYEDCYNKKFFVKCGSKPNPIYLAFQLAYVFQNANIDNDNELWVMNEKLLSCIAKHLIVKDHISVKLHSYKDGALIDFDNGIELFFMYKKAGKPEEEKIK